MTTDLLDRPDARVTFDVRGTGPLLVLVGSPMGAEGFGPLADAMAADHTVVRFDPRGTGRSPTEDPDADSTVALRAARPVSSPGCGRCRRAPDSGGAVRQDGAVISTTAAGDAVRARPDSERRRRARAALHDLLPQLSREAVAALGAVEAAGFLARTERWYADAHLPLEALYGAVADPGGLTARLVRAALAAAAARPQALRELDRRREVDGDWFQDPRTVGYVAYTDRFAGTLRGIRTRLDHLSDLGVRYLHLMPLLRPRDGENDGGYAVADYTAVDPRLGTMDDLESLAGALRERGMSLCVDLVLNHTAAEHPWARGWLAGDPRYAGFYTAYPDREMPDAWEATIPDVFPDRAPGSFSWVPGANGGDGGWVWTTFWDYQWDLDWTCPEVFAAMLGTVFTLAGRGVEVLRMDAAPFLGKRLGTNCQNQPEAHDVLQALHALTRIAAPAVVFKAEAIVAPDDLVGYLGAHDRYRPECELAYHNQLMVMVWSSLATRDARLAAHALRRMTPAPPTTAWATYVRCHDDIGWAVSDVDAAAVGWDGPSHRRFLNDFFAGRFPGSFARGALFQEDPDTGDARISGSAAALCGIDDARARHDPAALDAGVRRLLLAHAVVYGWGGIPLLYMGDELALANDTGYRADPERAADNRWMHRPPMDEAAFARRYDPDTVEGRVFGALTGLAAVRAELPALHASAPVEVPVLDDPAVLGWTRRHPRGGRFVGLVNVSDRPASVDAALVTGLDTVLSSDGPVRTEGGRAHLPPLSWAWLAEP
ncbi:alpha-amylase family protein [Pseudonocardia alni]|uniref:alpha-amylase family protein n=1 Tax=Pseudonocardia TaxID=1847 RepID=UPI00307D8FF5